METKDDFPYLRVAIEVVLGGILIAFALIAMPAVTDHFMGRNPEMEQAAADGYQRFMDASARLRAMQRETARIRAHKQAFRTIFPSN